MRLSRFRSQSTLYWISSIHKILGNPLERSSWKKEWGVSTGVNLVPWYESNNGWFNYSHRKWCNQIISSLQFPFNRIIFQVWEFKLLNGTLWFPLTLCTFTWGAFPLTESKRLVIDLFLSVSTLFFSRKLSTSSDSQPLFSVIHFSFLKEMKKRTRRQFRWLTFVIFEWDQFMRYFKPAHALSNLWTKLLLKVRVLQFHVSTFPDYLFIHRLRTPPNSQHPPIHSLLVWCVSLWEKLLKWISPLENESLFPIPVIRLDP